MSYYQLWDEIRKFPTASAAKRKEVMDQLCSAGAARDYSFASLVEEALKHATKDEAIRIFDNMVSNYVCRRSYYEDTVYGSIRKIYELDKDHVKKSILARKDGSFDKVLLAMDGLTAEEEARGLRALSLNKHCPATIHNARYAPTKDAINLLPPVMRLKVLESLSDNNHLAYNVFKNFQDADEFKSLMFSSVMRHRDRAEAVWNKYQEISYLGINAEVLIKGQCDNCGDFEVIVKSTRVRTKTGLQATNLWHSFSRGCALCGDYKNKNIEVIGQSNEQGTS